MHVVAVLNLKGGAGKTTLAVNLAATLAERKRRVVILDTDPQQSATQWARHATIAPPHTRFSLGRDVRPVNLSGSAPGAVFKDALQKVEEVAGADLVVIDCPPELDAPAMVAAMVADLVLIPCTPSPLDAWAARAAVQTVHKARKKRRKGLPRAALVPSRLIVGTTLARDLPATLGGLGEPVAPSLTQRVAVAESPLVGQTVAEYAPGSPAHKEFQTLARFVLKTLEG